ncbi:MAG TPA: hypothetical protein VJH90_02095 [archaeon]|nr:hypothetical protein [archaeon]
MINSDELRKIASMEIPLKGCSNVTYRGNRYGIAMDSMAEGYEKDCPCDFNCSFTDSKPSQVCINEKLGKDEMRGTIVHALVELDLHHFQSLPEFQAHEKARKEERDVAIEKGMRIRKIAMLGVDKAPKQSDFYFFERGKVES